MPQPPLDSDPPHGVTADEVAAPTVGPAAAVDADAGRDTAIGAGLRLNETLQTVLVALLLAFVFRAFFVEAFVIPSGSMADTLLGVHGTHVCPSCGWEYNFGVEPGNPDTPPEIPAYVQCPNCGYEIRHDPSAPQAVKAGDRILVEKWPYLFPSLWPPARWDIIVFVNPQDPRENYIKRLVGLPGETIEMVDGDIYVNGEIARKGYHLQRALWLPVFDQRYVPRARTDHPWLAHWLPVDDEIPPAWTGLDQRVIHARVPGSDSRAITFRPTQPIVDTYAYNNETGTTPVGDIRVSAEVRWLGGPGPLTWNYIRDRHAFRVSLYGNGEVELHVTSLADPTGQANRHARRVVQLPPAGHPFVFSCACVDQVVSCRIDGEEVVSTGDTPIEDLAWRRERLGAAPPALSLAAATAELELRGLRVDRDVHYTISRHTRRGYINAPVTLEADEYFVLGDNSPVSRDSRAWTDVAPRIAEHYTRRHATDDAFGRYRLGTVRSDLIVGRAAFVYLPGLMPLDPAGRWRMLDVGRVRFVR